MRQRKNLNSQTCPTRGYSSGTLACNSDCSGFDTSGCTSAAAVVKPVETPGGSSSGGAPSPTEFSSVTSVDVVKGEFAVFTTAQSADFTSKGVSYVVDIKQIGEDFVRVWVYSPEPTNQTKPIEIIISVGKRVNIDLDGDSWADVSVELRYIKDGNAFLYFKELKSQGPSKISIPTGKQVFVEEVGEEDFELPKITLIPEGLTPTKIWMKILQDFERFIKEKVDYWMSQIKTKKSWLLPSAAFISLLFLFFVKSLSFYRQRKSLR